MDFLFWQVDCQKDFMLPTGLLYIKGCEKITNNLSKLTRLADEENVKVVNTADYHTSDSKEISVNPDFVNTFPSHCIVGTEGQDFIDEVYPKKVEDNYYIVAPTDETIDCAKLERSRNIIIFKDSFNVFDGNKLVEAILKLLNPQIVIIYGVTTSICVKYAVEGLLKRDYNVVVVKDAITGLDEEADQKTIGDWEKRGVNFVTTDELIDIRNGA